MKLRTLRYHFNEGVAGIFKNGLMSFASIAVVSACIFILILSLCFVVNVGYVLDKIEANVGISIMFGEEPDEKDIAQIEQKIKNLPHVTEVKYCSKDDAINIFKERYDTDLESLRDDNPLPRSLDIRVDSVSNQEQVIKAVEELQRSFEQEFVNREPATEATTEEASEVETNEIGVAIPQVVSPDGSVAVEGEANTPVDINAPGYVFRGIETILHLQDLTDTLITINIVINICSIVLLIVLAIISIVIIMNTIKLTVFIRKNEINIMKYIGATDWFIRWPFVIEGVIIGLIGAAIPCFVCWLGYDSCVDFVNNLRLTSSIIQLKETADIFYAIAPFSLMIGVLLGAIGSISSLEKHLNV